ncbi:DUF4012 domain-containing protein [Demequina gelatinilytica]|uniref:DUF4012 domain-containing protein n=1 Tax=Demequina gelatinilytica TaxID=1638980 RepID=UPI00078292C4|nr:DUF4012 domain-containing protein [Demequina gelatinilytica]
MASEATDQKAPETPDAAPRKRPWRWIALGVAVVLLAAAVVMGLDAWRAYGASRDLAAHSTEARSALVAGDVDTMRTEVGAVQEAAHALDGSVDGPLWWLAEHAPWVGAQVEPVTTMARAAVAVADDALVPLAQLDDLDALSGPTIDGGRIDPYLLEPARDALAVAAQVLDEQTATLAEVSLGGTVAMVAAEYRDATSQLEELADLVDGAHRAAELFPTMLGAEGARTYLVMVQNNAEPRATGGIPGSVVELHVDDGRIALGRFVPASHLVGTATADPVVELTADESATFTDRMARYPQDANFTPEFPRAAELISAFWSRAQQALGEDASAVDGVLAMDPVALGYLLEGSAPLDVDGVTLDSHGLSTVMLNSAYSLFDDADAQDAFFATAASSLFDAVVAGAPGLASGIERALDEGRVRLWSAHADEQAVLDGSAIAGTFLEDGGLGVFLNDGSGSKIGYYIDTAVDVTDRVCTDGTVAGQTVAVTLTHTFDGDVAALPEYIAGGFFVPAGEFHANLVLAPMLGTRVTSVMDGEESAWVSVTTVDGRTLVTSRIVLAPGESLTYTYDVDAPGGAVVDAGVTVTPGARTPQVTRTAVVAAGC